MVAALAVPAISAPPGYPKYELPAKTRLTPHTGRLELKLSESFTLENDQPAFYLSVKSDKEYPDGCYRLATSHTESGRKIQVHFAGVSHCTECGCTAAFQAPGLSIRLPSGTGEVDLVVRHASGFDKIRIDVSEAALRMSSLGPLKLLLVQDQTLTRIPLDVMMVSLSYMDRDRFRSKTRELVDLMKSLGATRFVPSGGPFTVGRAYGLTRLDRGRAPDGETYMSGHYFDDYFYFHYSGRAERIATWVEGLKPLGYCSGCKSGMSATITARNGVDIRSWLHRSNWKL